MTNLATFLGGISGLVLALLLLALLGAREVARISGGPRGRALARALTVAATPLLIIFVVTVAVLIAQAFH